MAPPTPTTTPITVLFVFGDMDEDVDELEERAAVPVAFDEEVVVDEREVITLPETVVITVTTPTLAGELVEGVGVGVGVGVSELEVDSSCVLDELLSVGVELDDGVGVGVGVLDGVLLAEVLFMLADVEEDDEPAAAVPVPNNPPTRPVATELISERMAFFSTSRGWKRFESNQLA